MSWTPEDDIDAPQQIDLDEAGDDEDDGAVVDCPACGEWMSEHAPRCPACGEWVADDTEATRRSRGWFWPIMVVGLVALILVLWHGLGR